MGWVIICPTGPKGPRGPRSPRGARPEAAQGAQGPRGPNGARPEAAQGSQGPKGPTGASRGPPRGPRGRWGLPRGPWGPLPSPAKVVLVSLQNTLFGFHTTNICFIYSKYEDCADWKLPDLDENHENCFEPGPYGTVWADNCAESLPPALGSLWDASRTPKPPQKIQKSRVWGV